MNVKELKDLLQGFNDETVIKIGGYQENYTRGSNFTYEINPLAEKHFHFDENSLGKLTIILESDIK